jgi:quercetin dioxygenase-like cupin family protein
MSSNEASGQPSVLDANALAQSADREGAIWSISSEQLNINLVRFAAGHGVDEHRNDEVDVLGVVVTGEATLSLPAGEQRLHPGVVFYLPRGTTRAIRATHQPFAYISCHQRRPGLWPTSRREVGSPATS